MKNNHKRPLLVVLMLTTCVAAMAQGESVAKQINQIKRNSSYLYSEATMASEAEAQNVAYELLMEQVKEYISSKRNLSSADNVLLKDIKSKGQSMSMPRGEMHRVFVYVKKSDIEGVGNTTVINSESGVTVTIADNSSTEVGVKPGSPVNTDKSQASVATHSIEYPSHSRVEDSRAVSPSIAAAEKAERTLQKPTNPQVEENKATKPSTSTTRPAKQRASIQHSTMDEKMQPMASNPLTGWQKNAIETLLECTDITAMRANLNRMKAEYVIKRYGTVENCKNKDQVYWAVFGSDGKLVTILGPGSTQRFSFKSGQYSTLEEYGGYDALWFSLSK